MKPILDLFKWFVSIKQPGEDMKLKNSSSGSTHAKSQNRTEVSHLSHDSSSWTSHRSCDFYMKQTCLSQCCFVCHTVFSPPGVTAPTTDCYNKCNCRNKVTTVSFYSYETLLQMMSHIYSPQAARSPYFIGL